MKLKRYLQEDKDEELTVEINYTELEEDNCINLIKKSYYIGLNNKYRIYRGINNDANYMYVNPKLVTRRSAYASKNYYTELLDFFKSWKDYPKRSKSLICTTKYGYASKYAADSDGIYVVIPKNNAKIGVCPEEDIWSSFQEISNLNFETLNDFNIDLAKLFTTIYDSPTVSIVKACKNITKRTLEIYDIVDDSNILIDFNKSNYFTLYEYLEHLMDPKLNDFELITVNDLSRYDTSHELWTDSECILIKNTLINDLINKVNQ